MGNEIQKSQSFEERMKERIKESIGDLITDEELSVIVKKGIEVAFFQKEIRKNDWGSVIEEKNPVIVSIVKEVLRDSVDKCAIEWFKENEKEMDAIVEKIVREGISKVFLTSMDNLFMMAMDNLKFNIQSSISQMMQR